MAWRRFQNYRPFVRKIHLATSYSTNSSFAGDFISMRHDAHVTSLSWLLFNACLTVDLHAAKYHVPDIKPIGVPEFNQYF